MPTAEEAVAANLLYRQQNNLPTDSASMGVSSTLVSNAQILLNQQDAQQEAQKRYVAFSQPRTDYQAPSQAFLDIQNQYAQQRSGSIGSGGQQAQGEAAHAAFVQQPGYVQNTGVSAPIQVSRYANQNPAEPFQSTVPISDISSNAPTRAENLGYTNFEQQAIQNAALRPGFTNISDLGDSQTQLAITGVKAMASMGFNVATPDVMAYTTLETQRRYAALTPGIRDDRYFGNELQKYVENKVEVSSSYHHLGQDLGVPIPANIFEYQGDLAVEFLKGKPTKDSEMFSPVSGEMSQYLPNGGEGLQQYEWRSAIATATGTEQPKAVSYMGALDYLASAAGKYGPYGALAGARVETITPDTVLGERVGITPTSPTGVEIGMGEGSIPKPFTSVGKSGETTVEQPTGTIFGYTLPVVSPAIAFFESGTKTTQTLSVEQLPESTKLLRTEYTPIEGGMQTTKYFESSGGKQTTISSVSTPTASGFEQFEQSIRDRLPSTQIGERATEIATVMNPLMAGPTIASLITERVNPSATKDTQTVESLVGLRGQYTYFYEHPTGAVINYAIGAGFGTAAKGIEEVYLASKALSAERIISEGQTARAADVYGNFIMTNAPKALGVLYSADVARRSTEGFTNFEPSSVIPATKGIVMQESVPMAVGFGLPGQITTAIKTSDIGYKAALESGRLTIGENPDVGLASKLDLSGTTTGRFDYYVKQPAMKPIELLKSDYASFTQEGGIGKINYVIERGGFNIVPEAAPTTLKYTPAQTGELAEAAYGKQSTIFDIVKAQFDITPAKEISTFPARYVREPGSPVFEEVAIKTPDVTKAYGKQPTIFDRLNDISKQGEQVEPSRKFITEKTSNTLSEKVYPKETLSIKLDAYLQENPNIARDIKSQIIRPEQEISDINKMYELNKAYKPNVKTVDTNGISQSISKSTAGSPASINRMGTKIVGGKSVSGLSREPSLRSMGREPTTVSSSEGFAKSRSIDFRGNPKSETMKPMGEQAKGVKQSATAIQVMREPLPVVEGMTTGKISEVAINVLPYQASLQVPRTTQRTETTIEPELAFSQESQTRRGVMQVPIVSQMQSLETTQLMKVDTLQEITQKSKQETAFAQLTGVVSESKQNKFIMADRASEFERATAYDTTIKTERGTIITPVVDITSRVAQDTKTSQVVEPIQTIKKEIITPPIIPIPGIPWLPSGGGGGTGVSRRPKGPRKTEIFSYAPTSLAILGIEDKKSMRFFRAAGNGKIMSASATGEVTTTQYQRKSRRK
jgi:hypothetical protein